MPAALERLIGVYAKEKTGNETGLEFFRRYELVKAKALLQDLEQGESYAGLRVVVTVTGHGLKDTATALEGLGGLVDTVVDPDVDEAARAAGLTQA